jgi:hypothetical protein
MSPRRTVLFALLALASPHVFATARDDDARYRAVLLAGLQLSDDAARIEGRGVVDGYDPLRGLIAGASPDFFDAVRAHLPPIDDLESRIRRAQVLLEQHEAAVAPAPATRAIALPEPSPHAPCGDTSPYQTEVTLTAWGVAAEILAASKWACLESVAGENGAEGCTILSIGTAIARASFEVNTACLEAQRDAVLDAILETQNNIADFMNDRIDATVTSRASQVSIDALQIELDDLGTRLVALRDAQDRNDAALTQALSVVIERVVALTSRLDRVSALTRDVQFRTQIVQADVEDAQDNLADAQAEASRIAADGRQLRVALATIQATLAGAQGVLTDTTTRARDRRLAAALADPGRAVIRFRVPVASGGELERSREVVIRAIAGYESLGADVTAARALLATADGAYNQGRALDAYDGFSRAYRLLLDAQTTASVVIARDSFE